MEETTEEIKTKQLVDGNARDGIDNILKSIQDSQENFQALVWLITNAETQMVRKQFGVTLRTQQSDSRCANHLSQLVEN